MRQEEPFQILNYEYYITNQIKKPISQIYGLCLEDLPGYYHNIDFDAIWLQNHWQSEIPHHLTPYMEGQLAWQGQLKLFNVDGGGFNV